MIRVAAAEARELAGPEAVGAGGHDGVFGFDEEVGHVVGLGVWVAI
jgi:hypothetical protein